MLAQTLFVRWFHIRLTVWIHTQWRSARIIPFPNFNILVDMIELGEAWEPQLPLKYELMLREGASSESSGGNLATAIIVGGIVGGGRAGGGGGIVSSAYKRGGTVAETRIANTPGYKDTLLRIFTRLGFRVRGLLANAPNPPPAGPHDLTDNTLMCVTYHVKGTCNDRCRRAKDHHPHTDAQSNYFS